VDIGTEKPAIIVEPVTDPYPNEQPQPDPEPEPTPAPDHEPVEVPA